MAKVSAARAPSLNEVAARVEQLARLHHRGHSRSPAWLDHELTFGQLRLLWMLREEAPLPMSRLAELMGVTPATATGVIERIERRGLALRRHRVDDRRVVECALTASGEQLVRAMADARSEAVKDLLGVFTPDELGQFDRLLAVVVGRLTERSR